MPTNSIGIILCYEIKLLCSEIKAEIFFIPPLFWSKNLPSLLFIENILQCTLERHFCRYRRYLNFMWFPLKKYTVAPVATIAEIEIFLSQRCSSLLSLPSLLSLNSVFPYISTVAETRFSTTGAIVVTGAIIWKPGLSKKVWHAY